MIWDKGDEFIGLKESTGHGVSSFDGFVIRPDGSKVPTELKNFTGNLNSLKTTIGNANHQLIDNGVKGFEGQVLLDVSSSKASIDEITSAIKGKFSSPNATPLDVNIHIFRDGHYVKSIINGVY